MNFVIFKSNMTVKTSANTWVIVKRDDLYKLLNIEFDSRGAVISLNFSVNDNKIVALELTKDKIVTFKRSTLSGEFDCNFTLSA